MYRSQLPTPFSESRVFMPYSLSPLPFLSKEMGKIKGHNPYGLQALKDNTNRMLSAVRLFIYPQLSLSFSSHGAPRLKGLLLGMVTDTKLFNTYPCPQAVTTK